MIIEVEDRFCKVAQVLSQMLTKVEHAAAQGAPVHEVEESAFSDLLEMGRQTVTAFIERQREDVPRPKTIEHAEKTLRRLRGQRKRAYMSAFGPTPFQRDVYATRETQRQEVVPLDAKLGMPEGDVSYLRKLLEGKVRRVIGGIRQMVTKADLPKHKRQKARRYLNYFAARCDYMKYDEYLAAGYPIGSGVVEGACRHLVKDRMEQTGMRWRIAGAQAVLSLRAIYLNDDWDTFHADRIQAEQRKLYPYKTRLHATLNCAT
jgi:hypothetical protein